MSDDLARFFAAIQPFLRGQATPGELAASLGDSPSGLERLAIYPQLVASDLRGVMEALYPGVKLALERAPGSWHALLTRFERAHPAKHWDINRFGEPFAPFVAADATLPPWVAEVADFQWVEYEAFTSLDDRPWTRGVNPTTTVRQYTHAVPAWARAARAGTAEGEPVASPVTCLVYRDPRSLLVRTLYPRLAALVVLALRQEAARDDVLRSAAVPPEQLRVAADWLRREGVLGTEAD